ncbi:MAG: hypothetical protein J4A00_10325 [Gammaproteobacteria bacterium]|nr:hypothetical protein [Gammaproteobacteria bacterium]
MQTRRLPAQQAGYRNIRMMVLLGILFFVAVGQYLAGARATDWRTPLSVALHPVIVDDSAEVKQYISRIGSDHFSDIDDFFSAAARRNNLPQTTPVETYPGRPVDSVPPLPDRVNSAFGAIIWSLKFRFWVTRQDWMSDLGPERIHLFLLYHEAREGVTLPHSVGLEKGHVGFAHLFASGGQTRRNQVVIAHELLHTLGATDKYGHDGMPVHPDGFAEPDRSPLYPQRYAEIMGGRIPVTSTTAEMPGGLKSSRIGTRTACEIRWCDF